MFNSTLNSVVFAKSLILICKYCKKQFEYRRKKGAGAVIKYCSRSCYKAITAKNSYEIYHARSTDFKWRLARSVTMAKNRAISKGLPFNLDHEYLISLWTENNGCCALTGITFDLTSWGHKGQVNPNTVSVDRINPSEGYVKDNVRLITYHMNVALADFGTEQFEKLIQAYTGLK